MATLTFSILYCWIRIAIFVKMSGFVGLVCVLNVMLVCAGRIFTLRGKCHQQLQVEPDVTLCFCNVTVYTNATQTLFHSSTICTSTRQTMILYISLVLKCMVFCQMFQKNVMRYNTTKHLTASIVKLIKILSQILSLCFLSHSFLTCCITVLCCRMLQILCLRTAGCMLIKEQLQAG